MSEDNVQDSFAVEAGASAEDAEAARLKAEAEARAREAAEEAQARADAEEARAAMAAAQAAALQAEAEAENAERDALAASLAAMLAANATAVPEPIVPLDRVEAPRGSFGPTFWDELSKAGAAALAFVASADHVIFGSGISAEDRAKVMAVIEAHDPDKAAAVDLAAYAKAARDRHENGGITVGGVPVATDDRSKTLLTGARLRVEKDATLVTSFAAADGHVYPLTAAMILAVSDAIGAFVAELFEAYASIMGEITAGSIKTTDEIDARFGALDVAF